MLALTSTAVLIGGAQSLGRPKPSWMELPSGEDVQVLHVEWAENVAIWIEVAVPGRDEPTLYALPWNEENAAKLNTAEEKAKQQGTAVMIKSPFGIRNNGEFIPYPKPIAPLPPKGGQ